MEDPIKLIYKYKNLNKRIQYQLFIFVGFLHEDKVMPILEKIKKLNFYDTLIEISSKNYKILEELYGLNWYNKFFLTAHIQTSINLILKNPQKKKDLIQKYGQNWYNNHIDSFKKKDKLMYSYQFLFKQDREMKERKQRLREKKFLDNDDVNYSTKSLSQQGGNNEEMSDSEGNDDLDAPIENLNLDEIDDGDEFDLDELENMYKPKIEIDTDIATTSKLIDKIMKGDEKDITKQDNLIEFPEDKNDIMYDDSLKNVFVKNYIYNNYLFKDDTVKKIKEKICCSIKLNNIFVSSGDTKHIGYLIPSRQYLWTQHTFLDQEDNIQKTESVMLGQKWIKRTELLKIDTFPNENIKIYENLKGYLSNLRTDMRKYGSRIRREEDENNLLEEYDQYMDNNEIYMVDLYNDLGVNYTSNTDNLRNLFDIYIKMYFFHISSDELKNIVNYVNTRNDETNRSDEIKYMKQIYQTLNNDLIVENEIIKNVELLSIDNSEYKHFYKNNHITQSVIHSYLTHTNNFGSSNLDLFRIFDNFILSENYPFMQFQLPDGKMVIKFFTQSQENDKTAIRSKWFENSPYGISFKIKADQKGGSDNKYMAISLNDTGRLEYKIQWKEDDKSTLEDIKKTYVYVQNLINKINNENTKLKINVPYDSDFKYAFINSIQQFEITEKKNINHNDLSNFARYFYPYISLVIEPRKRQAKKTVQKEVTSKFGTYLRYKRVSKYDNEAKIEHRIIYFMRNYEYTEFSLVREISKQFNITEKIAASKIDDVRQKFPVIKRSRKILKKLENAPKYKPPGIDLNIQGKSRHNYKIRISGARNKNQLDRIVKFSNILIYLYVDTYINKNKKRQKLKDKLDSLTNIAKRRNKVEEIVDIDDIEEKDVKRKTKFDKERLGFRPGEGESHWSRACQNSGSDKKRQPEQYTTNNLNDLLVKGYKFNKENGFYEREYKKGKKTIILRAAQMTNLKDKGNNIYYVCNPEDNKEHTYVGFLQRSKNPTDLCMPCCFKKDPLDSNNIQKKNYYLKCMGKANEIDTNKKTIINDKIYILQDTNKIQEGRFGFLPKTLDIFLNSMLKNKVNIKNHYLINTQEEYLFKYGIKISDFSFLEAISSIYDISIEEIIKLLSNKVKESNVLFTSINSGDLKTQFGDIKNFTHYLNNNTYLDYEIIGDILAKPNIISKHGINYYIFERKNLFIKKELEKNVIQDDFVLNCNNIENDIYREDPNRDNIILLKDGKIYYPIFKITKPKVNSPVIIDKKFNYDDVIKHCYRFYKIGCNKNTVIKFNPGIIYNARNIALQLLNNNNNNKDFLPKFQTIDLRNKCRSIILNNNYVIPTYPSGIIDDIEIIENNDKYLYDLNKSLKNILKIDSIFDNLDFKPIGIQYTDTKNDKYYVVAFLLPNDINFIIKPIFITKNEVLKLAKECGRKEFIKINISIDELLDKEITKGKTNFEVDKRILFSNKNKYIDESYNLFRLEISNYLKVNEKEKDKIEKILENKKINNKEKKSLVKNILFKISNKELYNLISQQGGNEKSSLLVIDDDKNITNNYIVSNKRDICNTNIDKNTCNSRSNCKWHYNNCYFSIDKKNLIIFVNKIVEELVKDEMKSKEILSIDNYFVSDIVNYDQFTSRNNQKIIKSDVINVNKILSEIFGENNIPKIGKRKYNKSGKSINEENIENPLEKLGNIYIQNIIPNNNTIIRAFSNQYYWLGNNLYDTSFRNLGYYSDLQTDLTNYFKSNIIDFLKDTSNKDYIVSNLKKYLAYNINNFIFDFSNNTQINDNGIIELTILSKIYNIEIVIFDNFNNIIFILNNGQIIYDNDKSNSKILKKYDEKYFRNTFNIIYEYSSGTSFKPSKIKTVYYT